MQADRASLRSEVNDETVSAPRAENLRDKVAQRLATKWLKSALSEVHPKIQAQTIKINFDALNALIQVGAVTNLGAPRDVYSPTKTIKIGQTWNKDLYNITDDSGPTGNWEAAYATQTGVLLCRTINCTFKAAKIGELRQGQSLTQLYILGVKSSRKAMFLVNHVSDDSGPAKISTQIMQRDSLLSFLKERCALLT
jgi:hypothetical protein